MSGFAGRVDSNDVDPAVQLQDMRVLETNLRKSVALLRQLRRRYMLVVAVLVFISGIWTWQLRCKLAEHAEARDGMLSIRLWIAWALVGLTPLLLIFFAFGTFQNNIVDPSQFVHRLNTSLARFHLAYSTDRGQLLRVETASEISLRRPLRIRSSTSSSTR